MTAAPREAAQILATSCDTRTAQTFGRNLRNYVRIRSVFKPSSELKGQEYINTLILLVHIHGKRQVFITLNNKPFPSYLTYAG